MDYGEHFLGALFAAGFIFLFIMFIVGIVMYVLLAMGLYNLAMNNGQNDKAILAWVPIANIYLLGVLSGDARIFDKIDLKEDVVGILLAVLPFLTRIPILGFLVWVANIILAAYAFYNLYKKINVDMSIIMTILSVIFPVIVPPIYLFLNKDAIFPDDDYKVF